MTPRDGRPWLPVALLLLQVPGCWCLSGPTSVTGTVGGSLSVQCQYEEKFREMVKYWCKSPCVWSTVKTKEADLEESNGRVSIRDHPANLTFTVTMENLTEGDAGTYWCGIVTSWLPGYFLDPTFLVVVSVTPVPSSVRPTRTPGLHRILPAPTWSTMTPKESPNPSQYPGETWPVRGHFLETCRIWGAITQVSTEIGIQRQRRASASVLHRRPSGPSPVPSSGSTSLSEQFVGTESA
ncbi:CMRF35-like molecule 6 isoform X2 [Eumetopias jubatus]|uniref:CMRF35-like molecule 6 isoform X2 n=1 Tax=Eumetopias jubatus TaxID=34886 RepID=UPI001016FDDD|nr:CMRF35-like molecule 6 isoform X2 [Eumetopias jubatus]